LHADSLHGGKRRSRGTLVRTHPPRKGDKTLNSKSEIRISQADSSAGLWLRRAVIALAAAGLWVLPQFSVWPSLVGNPGMPTPMAALVVGLVGWLMPILVVMGWAAEGRAVVRRPLLAAPVALFIIGAAISTYYADDKSSAMVRAAEMSGLWMAMLALVQAVRTDGERRFLLAALVASALVLALGAMYDAAIGLPRTWQYFQANRAEVLAAHGFEPGGLGERMYIGRFSGGVQGAMAHPNILATFLVVGILVAAGLAREKWAEAGTRAARILGVVMAAVAALGAVGLVLTQGRAAEAALVAGLYVLAVAWHVKPGGRRIAFYAATPIVAAVGLAVAIYAVQPVAQAVVGGVQRATGLEGIPATVKDAGTGSATGGALASVKYRWQYWQATWPIITSHGLTGVGLSNFGPHYLEYKLPQAPEEIRDPHNMFLAMTSELGLAGLAAIALLLALAVRAWRRDGWASACVPGESKTCHSERAQRVEGPRRADAGGGKNSRVPRLFCARRNDALVTGAPTSEPLAGLLGLAFLMAAVGMIAVTEARGGAASLALAVSAGFGIVGVALAATVTGLGAAEDSRQLAVSGRPLRALRVACIVAVAAMVLQEQMGTGILDPAAAWAMLVVVGVSMGERKRPAAVGQAASQVSGAQQHNVIPASAKEPRNLAVDNDSSAVARRGPSASLGVTAKKEQSATCSVPAGVALATPAKFALVAAAMAVVFLYMTRVIVPVGRESSLLERSARVEDPADRDELLRAAAEANPLAWEPAMIRAAVWRAAASGNDASEAREAKDPTEVALDLEKAMDAFRDALARRPRLIDAERGMAECRLAVPGAAGDKAALEDARTYMEAALRLYPTSIRDTLTRAQILDRLGDSRAALEGLEAALRLDDQLPAASRRLPPDAREQVEARVRTIRETLAASSVEK
jgi:O-antigen ligase